MATFNSDVSGSGVRATLVNGEDLKVAAGVTVTSTDDAAVASAPGASRNHTATISGSLVGEESGLRLGSAPTDYNQVLKIGARGSVIANSVNGEAVVIQGSHSTVTNAGCIKGNFSGLTLDGGIGRAAPANRASTITNTGVIEAYGAAIVSDNRTGAALTVKNSGSLFGEFYSFAEKGNGPALITNTGLMDGLIAFGGGNDLYDGRKGEVTDSVFGQGGNDKLYGGAERNKLSGGAGNDHLIGGAGNDTFLFDAKLNAKTNVDRIDDFSSVRRDFDRFALRSDIFKGLTEDTDLSTVFHVGTKAHNADDRIVYDKTNGFLYYDHDGRGGDAQIKFAEVTAKTVLGYSSFLVYDSYV